MKLHLFLLLLLLGTVAALHVGNDAPNLDSQESQADLSQDLEGSGEQEGESCLTEEGIQSEGEQVEASSCQDAFEDDEKTMESDPGALDENLQCPRAEDTVEISGSPGCKSCRYKLVQTPSVFAVARDTCRRCYSGNLVSIHNLSVNNKLHCLSSQLNEFWVWIGGIVRPKCSTLQWIDGTAVDFRRWAHQRGHGHCVSLSTRGGHWRQTCCERRLPFICSI